MSWTRDHDSIIDIRLLADDWLFEDARKSVAPLPRSGYFSSDIELMQTFDVDKRKEPSE